MVSTRVTNISGTQVQPSRRHTLATVADKHARRTSLQCTYAGVSPSSVLERSSVGSSSARAMRATVFPAKAAAWAAVANTVSCSSSAAIAAPSAPCRSLCSQNERQPGPGPECDPGECVCRRVLAVSRSLATRRTAVTTAARAARWSSVFHVRLPLRDPFRLGRRKGSLNRKGVRPKSEKRGQSRYTRDMAQGGSAP
jgi:hypothetical protein